MSLALDIGSSGLRSLHRIGPALRGRQTPAVYLTLPMEPAERRLLEQLCVPFSACEDSYVVVGAHAVELAQALKLPLAPVLPGGRLTEHDPLGRQIAATLIEALIPQQGIRATTAGVIIPANPGSLNPAGDALFSFLQRLLALRGYRALAVHAGRACVLAELEDQGFTGIGFVAGSAATSMAIALNGRPLFEGTVRRGSDQIDEAFARSRGCFLFDRSGNRYLDLAAVARWRMAEPINLAAPRTPDEELLSSLFREWLNSACRSFAQQMRDAGTRLDVSEPLTLVTGGGPARMTGFERLAAEALRRAEIPVTLGEVRVGRSSEFTLVRGCLIAAEMELRAAARSA
ncbi:MAG: hypothetical protein KF774_14525 [Planctomyces sp.]|nr:hypothetical protein [Planctomyces sp.]